MPHHHWLCLHAGSNLLAMILWKQLIKDKLF